MNPVARRIRENILKISAKSGHGHIPTCFSVVECLLAAYGVMRHDPARPDWEGRDLFVLSKGHASLGLYCVLAELSYFPVERVHTFGGHGSDFGCHPDRHKVPGVEVSTGSLGHGIGVAAGMALGAKLAGRDRQVYVLVGDGESNEGTVWEAAMVAAHQGLDNLTVLFDANDSQRRCLPVANPGERFAAFGWEALEADGHDLAALEAALRRPRAAGQPRVVVARTVKGQGCRTLVDEMFAWHRRSPKGEELAKLLAELEEAGHAN